MRAQAHVLIHGIGSQGKSSLAARIANRMPRHETVVVVDRYDALAIFEQVIKALPPRLMEEFETTWRKGVSEDEKKLLPALVDLLEGPFRATDPATRAGPILLIMDDLEQQALEDPKPGETATPVKRRYGEAIAAVIAAFRDAQDTDSRLLFTSRYTFALTDFRGDDLAARLVPVPLPPMDEVQRDKQMRATARLAPPGAGQDIATEARATLEERIKDAAGGNPGLQALLFRPLAGGDSAAATRAVEDVEHYLASGAVPGEASAAAEFFKRVSLQAFSAMLTADETQQLRAATLFDIPVPRPVLEAAGAAASVPAPGPAIDRLQGLGLIDVFIAPGAADEAAVNPLVRGLAPKLTESETARLAAGAIGPLHAAWSDADDNLPRDRRGLEAARLALLGDAPPAIVNSAALAGGGFLFHGMLAAEPALDLVQAALAALDRAKAAADLHLLRLGAECAERLGRTDIQQLLIERGLQTDGGGPRARAMLLVSQSQLVAQKGVLHQAETLLRDAATTFATLGDVHSRAVTMGQIADILEARGQLDDALKIRTEEELPVFDRLGDVRSRSVTLQKIAAGLIEAGGLEQGRIQEIYEALAEAFAIAQKLGLPDGVAYVGVQLAQVMAQGGLRAEALGVLDEAAAAFQKLDHADGLAHVGALRAAIRGQGGADGPSP